MFFHIRFTFGNILFILFIIAVIVSAVSSYKIRSVKKERRKIARMYAEAVLMAYKSIEAEISSGTKTLLTIDDIKAKSGVDVILGEEYINNSVVVTIRDNKLRDIRSLHDNEGVRWNTIMGWETESFNKTSFRMVK
jgi:ABC-type Na+ efflux pump permease subunit